MPGGENPGGSGYTSTLPDEEISWVRDEINTYLLVRLTGYSVHAMCMRDPLAADLQ